MDQNVTDRLLKNYFNARKSWGAWCYLNNIDLKSNKPEVKNYADNNELLYYVRYLLLKDLHIELYKILKNSRSNVDNIFKLLKSINSSQAEEHLSILHKFEDEFKYITNTRDKYFAHLDINYRDFLRSFNIDNYYVIFDLIEQAIILLGKKKELLELLETIPSRDDFDLKT